MRSPRIFAPDVLNVPAPLSEMEIARLMTERAAIDGRPLNFIGAGAYEHHIPAPVWAIATRGEFYSAYTPYQAEASQGTLQLIYEYQSMMCALTGMEVSNASLYDGASALAEACLMAVRSNRSFEFAAHFAAARRESHLRAGGAGHCRQSGHQLRARGFRPVGRPHAAGGSQALQRPGFHRARASAAEFFRQLGRGRCAHRLGARQQDHADRGRQSHLAGAAQSRPAQWGAVIDGARGADIVCGEGQALGVPLSSGGPYFGFMATRMQYVRQMPGRIVGRTVDVEGRRASA